MIKTLMAASWLTAFSLSAHAVSFDKQIAGWTFETSLPAAAGPYAPEGGSGSATGFHASTAIYSSPVGNASAHSFSSNTWAVGDYYQFSVSTAGYSAVSISFDQISSSTGPGSFQLAYSTDGSSFTNFGSAYTVLANATPNTWNSTTLITATSYGFSLFSVAALNNQSSVYFRLLDASTVSAGGGTVASGGTSRIDNFTVSAIPVPEAGTAAMLLAGLVALGFIAKRIQA